MGMRRRFFTLLDHSCLDTVYRGRVSITSKCLSVKKHGGRPASYDFSISLGLGLKKYVRYSYMFYYIFFVFKYNHI